MSIKERLKSPVVIIQLISIISGAVIILSPSYADTVKIITGAIVGIISVVAGLNNPTDKEKF